VVGVCAVAFKCRIKSIADIGFQRAVETGGACKSEPAFGAVVVVVVDDGSSGASSRTPCTARARPTLLFPAAAPPPPRRTRTERLPRSIEAVKRDGLLTVTSSGLTDQTRPRYVGTYVRPAKQDIAGQDAEEFVWLRGRHAAQSLVRLRSY
jgi:hypothetical protein